MATLIFSYSPKDGISPEEFERFLLEVDQRVCLSQPSVISSRIFHVKSDKPSFDYIELLEVTSFEEWDRDSKTPEVKDVVDQWSKYSNTEDVKAHYCEEFFSEDGEGKK